jgi:CspA family cold shock protein
MKGKVKWYNRVKGYGFLVPEDGSPEVFVHHSAIQAKGKDKVLVDGQASSSKWPKGTKGPFRRQRETRGETGSRRVIFSDGASARIL